MTKTLKSTLAVLLAIVLLISAMPITASAAASDMKITVSTKNAMAGQTVEIDVAVSNNPGVAAISLDIDYDKDNLILMGFTYNTDALAGAQTTPYNENARIPTLFMVNGTANIEGDFKFATLTFKVKDNAQENISAPVTVTFDPDNIYNIAENNIDCIVVGGVVNIISCIPGDINGDEKVNSKDVSRLMQYHAHWDVEVNEPALDTNGDGKLNSKDVTRLMQYLAHWDVELHPLPPNPVNNLTAVAAVPAACVTEGNIAYWYDSKNNKYYKDASGLQEITYEETIIKALGHSPVTVAGYPATTEREGLSDGIKCSVCGHWLQEQTVIPKLKDDEYSITYNIANGDSYLSSIVINNPNPDHYSSSSGLTLRNISVPGYTFLGWYDLPAGANAEIVKKIPKGETGSYELYAHWDKIEYTIQFESDLIPVNGIKYTVDKGVTLPIPHLDGYNFIGWSNGDGEILKIVPTGTIGNKVFKANWLSERNKAWSKKSIGDPIILEDDDTNTILFTYEIGRIENVPLYVIEDFGYINSEGVSRTISTEYSVKTSKTLMDQYATNVSNATTNSSQWSLSSGWNDSVSVNEKRLEEEGLTIADTTTLCKTDSSNWLISNGSSGSTTTTTYKSSQDYDLYTATGNTKTYDTHDETSSKTHKQSVEVDLKYEHKASKLEKMTPIGENNFSAELDVGYEGSRTKTSKDKTGTEDDDGYSDQTGKIKHTGTDTVKNGGWNSSSSYGGSKSVSESNTIAKTVSSKIASEYGYGKTYTTSGNESSSVGLSTSTTSSKSYSSSVTYSLEESDKKTITYTTSNTKTGYHRLIKAGTAHVFAIVGYDIKTSSYFTSTFTVMDDEMHDFEDYSYSSAAYDDNQTGVISFEVPYDVEEYVLSKVGETDGLEFNSAGMVTGYNGSETTVIIPEYHVVDNLDGTKSVIKVTGISGTAFRGNTNITGIQLSDFITEIPANAFDGCTSLYIVDMPNVVSIGAEAFKNCKELNSVFLSQTVESLGENTFDNLKYFGVYTSNKDVIDGAINSGAKNIVVYISASTNDTSKRKLTVSSETEKFILNGCGNTFNNLLIESNASTTIVNNIKLNSTSGTLLKISSPDVQLGKTELNSSGIALELSNNNCKLGLYGESSVVSGSGNTVLCKNVELEKTEDAVKNGVYSELDVNGKILVCGSIVDNSLLKCNGGIFVIDEDAFAKYDQGQYIVSFDPQGGTASTEKSYVYYGEKYGTLPTASRDYYTFDGWYTAKTGGSKVTANTVFEGTDNVYLYAHWTAKPTSSWVLESNLPSNAKVVDTKWTYDLTSYTTSSSSSLSGWTQYNSTWVWSDWGSWSSWSKTAVSGSDFRQVNTKTVTDQAAYTNYNYYYYRYWNSSASKYYYTYGPGMGGTKYTKTLTSPMTYHNTYDGYNAYTKSGGGYYNFSGEIWFLESTQNVAAKTHTEYQYRDRSKVYTYYYSKVDNLEATSDPTGQENVSNVQKWVKYIEK